MRHDNFRQQVFRQACDTTHVLGDSFDSIKQQFASFFTRIADRNLQMRAIGNDVVLGP